MGRGGRSTSRTAAAARGRSRSHLQAGLYRRNCRGDACDRYRHDFSSASDFGLDATATSHIKINALGPIRVTANGPAAVRVALSNGRHAPRVLEAPLGSDSTTATFAIVPVLLGAPRRLPPSQLAVDLMIEPVFRTASVFGGLPIHRPAVLTLSTSGGRSQSFFRDYSVSAACEVRPSQQTAAVRSSTQTLTIRADAPFRRVLLIGAIVGFALAVLYVFLRLVARLTIAELAPLET
jgi:hypothetical protein